MNDGSAAHQPFPPTDGRAWAPEEFDSAEDHAKSKQVGNSLHVRGHFRVSIVE